MSSACSGLAQRQWPVRCLILIDNSSVTTLRQYVCSLLPHILTQPNTHGLLNSSGGLEITTSSSRLLSDEACNIQPWQFPRQLKMLEEMPCGSRSIKPLCKVEQIWSY